IQKGYDWVSKKHRRGQASEMDEATTTEIGISAKIARPERLVHPIRLQVLEIHLKPKMNHSDSMRRVNEECRCNAQSTKVVLEILGVSDNLGSLSHSTFQSHPIFFAIESIKCVWSCSFAFFWCQRIKHEII
ncbi:unnamed protein product, partial [Cladocopium goreaui]